MSSRAQGLSVTTHRGRFCTGSRAEAVGRHTGVTVVCAADQEVWKCNSHVTAIAVKAWHLSTCYPCNLQVMIHPNENHRRIDMSPAHRVPVAGTVLSLRKAGRSSPCRCTCSHNLQIVQQDDCMIRQWNIRKAKAGTACRGSPISGTQVTPHDKYAENKVNQQHVINEMLLVAPPIIPALLSSTQRQGDIQQHKSLSWPRRDIIKKRQPWGDNA